MQKNQKKKLCRIIICTDSSSVRNAEYYALNKKRELRLTALGWGRSTKLVETRNFPSGFPFSLQFFQANCFTHIEFLSATQSDCMQHKKCGCTQLFFKIWLKVFYSPPLYVLRFTEPLLSQFLCVSVRITPLMFSKAQKTHSEWEKIHIKAIGGKTRRASKKKVFSFSRLTKLTIYILRDKKRTRTDNRGFHY